MQDDKTDYVDFLVDGEDGEMPSVALSTKDICLQWRGVPAGTFRKMQAMLSKPSGVFREVEIGQIFGIPLFLIEREGIFSFKASLEDTETDLLRVDLPPGSIAGIVDSLADAIEVWED